MSGSRTQTQLRKVSSRSISSPGKNSNRTIDPRVSGLEVRTKRDAWPCVADCLARVQPVVENFGDHNKVYGSIGGVIVLIVLLYYTGVLLLLGGELKAENEKAAQAAIGLLECWVSRLGVHRMSNLWGRCHVFSR